jgi:hypothetical protein
MSVLPQELIRKTSTESHESTKRSHSSSAKDQRFRELMKVTAIDDKPKEKGLFSLIEEEDESKETDGEGSNLANANSPLPPLTSLANSPISSPSTSRVESAGLNPQLELLFERMASSMIIMSTSGDTETTLFLDNSHFASSLFFGAKITIREFSTAPKAFNIEIASSLAAIHVLNAGKESLLSAFQNGKFNFSVHRLDTQVQSDDRPLFHRKENQDHDQQEQKGGQKQ